MKVLFAHDLKPDPHAPVKNFGAVIKDGRLLFPHEIAGKIEVLDCKDIEALVPKIYCDTRRRVYMAQQLKWHLWEVNGAVHVFIAQVLPHLSRDFLCKFPNISWQ